MRRSVLFFGFILTLVLLFAVSLSVGRKPARQRQASLLTAQQQLVAQLGLTDLAIWSEARYTRHPSQADLFTAFQNSPGAFDHFPAGSIIGPGQPIRSTSLRIIKNEQR